MLFLQGQKRQAEIIFGKTNPWGPVKAWKKDSVYSLRVTKGSSGKGGKFILPINIENLEAQRKCQTEKEGSDAGAEFTI